MSLQSEERSFDILMLGHFARDVNVIDGEEKVESGGAVYFGSTAAAATGAKVVSLVALNPRISGIFLRS